MTGPEKGSPAKSEGRADDAEIANWDVAVVVLLLVAAEEVVLWATHGQHVDADER